MQEPDRLTEAQAAQLGKHHDQVTFSQDFVAAEWRGTVLDLYPLIQEFQHQGRLAQMVERSLSMREAPGSIPGLSMFFSVWTLLLPGLSNLEDVLLF
jgi:hypothetical protein